jgi:di/tricarboxylate transporter
VITIHYHNRRINICNSPLLKTIQCLTSNNNSKLLVCKFKNIEIKHTFIALLTLTMKLLQLPCSLELLEYLNKPKKITEHQNQFKKINLRSHHMNNQQISTTNWVLILPSLKLVLNLRGRWRRYFIRPVPVVFLRIAFSLQLSKKQVPNDYVINFTNTTCKNKFTQKYTLGAK